MILKDLVPLVASGRMLLQVYGEKTGWDDSIGPEDNLPWLELLTSIRGPGCIKLPPCPFPNDIKQKEQLHRFSDAAEVGYGAIVYGQWKNEDSS